MADSVYVVSLVLQAKKRQNSALISHSVHITSGGAANGVVQAIEGVTDDPIAMEECMGEPQASFLRDTLEQISEHDSTDAWAFEHTFDVDGDDYILTVCICELED